MDTEEPSPQRLLSPAEVIAIALGTAPAPEPGAGPSGGTLPAPADPGEPPKR